MGFSVSQQPDDVDAGEKFDLALLASSTWVAGGMETD
jgi:hypothetical protein